jgi:CrcB protein
VTLPRLLAAAAAGGFLGAGARAWLTHATEPHTLTATLAINVVGCALLALLPAAAFVRRSHAWSTFLGTGVLGGFTTMSSAIVLPMGALAPARALAYIAITLAAALVVVRVVDALSPRAAHDAALVDEDR